MDEVIPTRVEDKMNENNNGSQQGGPNNNNNNKKRQPIMLFVLFALIAMFITSLL